MSSLEPRSGKRVSRQQREKRAFQLIVVGGVAGAVAVVGLLLAIATSFPLGVPVLAAIVAVICLVLFRRDVGL